MRITRSLLGDGFARLNKNLFCDFLKYVDSCDRVIYVFRNGKLEPIHLKSPIRFNGLSGHGKAACLYIAKLVNQISSTSEEIFSRPVSYKVRVDLPNNLSWKEFYGELLKTMSNNSQFLGENHD